jgi:hypothetical protein
MRWAIVLVAVAITGSYAVAAGSHTGSPFHAADADWYMLLAHGDSRHVMQPFASRQLGPALVKLLAWMLHWPIENAFLLEGAVSLAVTLMVVYALMLRTAAPRWLLAAVMMMPIWPQLWLSLALPDLWYAALLSIFLLLLARQQLLAAACMMFPLMISRESTSLTLLCFLIAVWRPLRWRGRLTALASVMAGGALVSHLTAQSPGNHEQLPQVFYLLLKAPWNFMRNVGGVYLWSNMYTDICPVPVVQHSFHMGPVKSVGMCGFTLLQPLITLTAGLTTFGLLVMMVAFLWWRTRHFRSRSPLLNFCLLYGGVSFVCAPLFGTAVYRLFGYSWPLYAIALPLLFDDLRRSEMYRAMLEPQKVRYGLGLLALHGMICAVTFIPLSLFVAGAVVTLNIAGFFLLRAWFGPPVSGSGETASENPQAAASAT